MFSNVLLPETFVVLQNLKNFKFIKAFYLAGGTSLALQLGHRRSIDLDFFINKLPPHENILKSFRNKKPIILLSDETGLNIKVNNTKVSFLQYEYPLLEKLIDYQGLKLAGVLDIACMKINAVTQRGEKKDYYDLYEILKEYSLKDLLNAYDKKFQAYNYQKLSLLKSLIYFDDADKTPEPILLKKVSWEDVKKKIVLEVTTYTKRESNF